MVAKMKLKAYCCPHSA